MNIVGESSYIWAAKTPINEKFVADIKAKTGNIPTGSEQNGYAIAKVVLAALAATGGDDSYAKFWPAAVAVKLDTPQGPLSFSPNGVAITDVYITQAEKAADGTYVLSQPLSVTKQVRDPLDK
jgi:hypothetical protein